MWNDLLPNEVPSWAEIRAAVAEGRIFWDNMTDPGSSIHAANLVLTETELMAVIRTRVGVPFAANEVLSRQNIDNDCKDLAPTAPANLTASDNGNEQIVLNWSHSSIWPTTRFYVYRRLYDSTKVNPWGTPYVYVSTTTYTDSNITVNTIYEYKVVAVYDEPNSATSWESPSTNTVMASASPSTAPAPSGLNVVDESFCENGAVHRVARVRWNPYDPTWETVLEYFVHDSWGQLAILDPGVDEYVHDRPAIDGQRYRVFQRSGTNTTATSGEAEWVLEAGVCPSSPASPGGSSVEDSYCDAGSTVYRVWLDWFAKNGWNVRVERDTDVNFGSPTLVGTFSAATGSHRDLPPGAGTYYYRFRYEDGAGGTSAWDSDSVTLTPICDPVIATCSGQKSGSSAWVEFETGDACESAVVQRSLNGSAYTAVQTINTTPNSAGYTSASYFGSPGDTIQFRVIPYSGDNASGTAGAYCQTLLLLL